MPDCLINLLHTQGATPTRSALYAHLSPRHEYQHGMALAHAEPIGSADSDSDSDSSVCDSPSAMAYTGLWSECPDDADATDTDTDMPDVYVAEPMSPRVGRRRESVARVASRWQLSMEDAKDIMATFEAAQTRPDPDNMRGSGMDSEA